MNTNLIKSFATKARTSLLQSVENRLKYWGINADGNHGAPPQKSGAGYIYGGQAHDDVTDIPKLWRELSEKVRTKEQYQDLVEEAAYTWFNRIMIIKIMEQNDLLPMIIAYTSGTEIPTIIGQAKNGSYSISKSSAQRLLANYLMNNEDEKALGLIIKDLFESNQVLQSIFGTTPECFNLLLPSDLLNTNGLIHQINVESGFDKDMYKEVELIGWIYQFYISDKKDEVFKGFKKNKKARAKDIPAATQIFTPKWIVKYMVENTVGKIYLDYNPDSNLRSEMKHLVESEDAKNLTPNKLIADITELTLLDPASGSGHILVEGFDLLMKMYKEEGYSTKQAARSILENNLYGLDIDDRAMQLARFAVLLKASQYDQTILIPNNLTSNNLKPNHLKPKIYAFPNPKSFNPQDLKDFLVNATAEEQQSFSDALELLAQGKNIGSALKLHLEDSLIEKIKTNYKEWNEKVNLSLQDSLIWTSLKDYIEVLLQLSKKYHAVVANPPYMTSDNFNLELSNYVDNNYKDYSNDLMTIFIGLAYNLSKYGGYQALITLHSWLYIDDFLETRKSLLSSQSIQSMILFGRGVFGSDFGSSAFVLTKGFDEIRNGLSSFYKLYELGKVSLVSKIEELENTFLAKKRETIQKQNLFRLIPKQTISPGLSENVIQLLSTSKLSDFSNFKRGIGTSDNKRFLRHWFEISFSKSSKSGSPNNQNSKWFPYNKGGRFRKWYGNQNYFINWGNDGFEIRNFKNEKGKLKSRPQNIEFNFQENVSYTSLTIGVTSLRYYPKGFINDQAGNFLNGPTNLLFEVLGFANSIVAVYIMEAKNPTVNILVDDLNSLPFQQINSDVVRNIVQENIHISKKDWDNQETSWDYKKSPLVNNCKSLFESLKVLKYVSKNEFFRLHSNEEELNKMYIESYDLSKELDYKILLKDVSILQETLNRNKLVEIESTYRDQGIEQTEIPIDESIIFSQFISYCMGLSMGRYRLDKEGLQIAHPNPSSEELANYNYNGYEIDIDDDAIIPLLGDEGNFPDDALLRTKQIILAIWGEVSHTDNMNFLQECLGMSLHKWLAEKFWTYHCSKAMYKKKPIYWLFCSNPKKPQKAAFRVLTYMHRMDKYTVQNIRTKYLHPHQEYIQSQISDLESNEVGLSKDEAKKLDLLRVQQIECMDYDDKLKSFANQWFSPLIIGLITIG